MGREKGDLNEIQALADVLEKMGYTWPATIAPHNHAHKAVVSPSMQRWEGTMLNLAAQRWGHKGRAFPEGQEVVA